MYIAVDVGGSKIRVAGAASLRVPPLGPIAHCLVSKSYHSDIAFITGAAQSIAGQTLEGVGIGVTGWIDETKRVVTRSFNNPHWEAQPTVALLEATLGCPVFMESDVFSQAQAEVYFNEPMRAFAYIIWGTGVGGVLIDEHGTAHRPPIGATLWTDYFRTWHTELCGRVLQQMYGSHGLPPCDRQKVIKAFSAYLSDFATKTKCQNIILSGGVAEIFVDEIAMLLPYLNISLTRFAS